MDRCPDCGYEPAIKEGVKPKTYGYAKLQHDLRKLVEEMEAKCPTQSDVVYDHMIHSGRQDVLRAIKQLLDGGE
jgi:hypothetical protein